MGKQPLCIKALDYLNALSRSIDLLLDDYVCSFLKIEGNLACVIYCPGHLREYLNDIIVRSDPTSPNALPSKGKCGKNSHRSFLGPSKQTKKLKTQPKEDETLDDFLEDNSDSENDSYKHNKGASKSQLELKNQRVRANFAAQGLQYGRSTLKAQSSSMVRLQSQQDSQFAIDHEMDLISM